LRSYAAAAHDIGISKRHERVDGAKSSRKFASIDPATRTKEARHPIEHFQTHETNVTPHARDRSRAYGAEINEPRSDESA
jgi:hypothetical protein